MTCKFYRFFCWRFHDMFMIRVIVINLWTTSGSEGGVGRDFSRKVGNSLNSAQLKIKNLHVIGSSRRIWQFLSPQNLWHSIWKVWVSKVMKVMKQCYSQEWEMKGCVSGSIICNVVIIDKCTLYKMMKEISFFENRVHKFIIMMYVCMYVCGQKVHYYDACVYVCQWTNKLKEMRKENTLF